MDHFDELLASAETLRAASPRGRYAPSPTGPQHLGNLRTALLAWLHARLAGGVFVLRIEDLDSARNRPGGAERIMDELRWLGIDWDEGPDISGPCAPYTQSQRTALYDAAFNRLRTRNLLFPCHCSRKDILLAASAPHEGAERAVYPGTCRTRAYPPPASAHIAWRFRVTEQVIEVRDEVAGPLAQSLAREVGDFVVRRADGTYAYQIAVIVDDALMGISDVVRGADLLDSTPRQIALLRALNLAPPRYWHVPLVRDASGERLAKRNDAVGLAFLHAHQVRAQDLIGRYAHELGFIDRAEPLSARELVSGLSLARFRAGLAAVNKDT